MTKEFSLDLENKFAVITFNYPKNKNALSQELVAKINSSLDELEQNSDINSVILTGEDFFSAGANLAEFENETYPHIYHEDVIKTTWELIANFKKPIISAVRGFAIGGGLEIMMMTDITIAEEQTKFGQSEIKLGLMPGAGGTQRLTKSAGKYRTMDLCLTGRLFDAEEAYQLGLLSYLTKKDMALTKAKEVATTLSGYSLTALLKIKQAVKFAHNSNLDQGLEFERNSFYSSFATKDAKLGIKSFLNKEKIKFTNQ